MIYLLLDISKTGRIELFLCKAGSMEEACAISSLDKDSIKWAGLTDDDIHALQEIDIGCIRKFL